MICKHYFYLLYFFYTFYSVKSEKDMSFCPKNDLTVTKLNKLLVRLLPDLQGKSKGDSGKIGIIGGSTEYTGAPYFAAMSSLKAGADLVYVITTENAAPVIKTYSPDLIVYPFLNYKSVTKINALLQKMDVVVIGPGLGREEDTINLINDIIQTCKTLQKPLVIDADGLFAVSKNPGVIKDYPSPGVILTPNHREVIRLMQSTSNVTNWFQYWGENVSVLIKGETDQFMSSSSFSNWASSYGGSGRRVAGQGDILAGFLGTFFSWALKSELCQKQDPIHSQSVAAYSAAKLTRNTNAKAFNKYGRNMIASDMLLLIFDAFRDTFV